MNKKFLAVGILVSLSLSDESCGMLFDPKIKTIVDQTIKTDQSDGSSSPALVARSIYGNPTLKFKTTTAEPEKITQQTSQAPADAGIPLSPETLQAHFSFLKEMKEPRTKTSTATETSTALIVRPEELSFADKSSQSIDAGVQQEGRWGQDLVLHHESVGLPLHNVSSRSLQYSDQIHSNSNDQSQAMQDKISTLQAENDRLKALLNDKEHKDQSLLTGLNDQSIALEEPVVVPAVVPDVSELQKAVQDKFPSLEKDDIDKVIQLVQAIKDSGVKRHQELLSAAGYRKLKNELYADGFPEGSGITPELLFQLSQPDAATAPSQSRPDILSAISNVAQSNENDSNRLDTQGVMNLSRPKPSFLSDIKVPTLKTSSGPLSVTDGQPQESLVFKSYGDYLTALTEVQKAAEAKALLPIEEKANKEFVQQWPVILQKYRSDRQDVGKPVQEDLIPLLELRTKKSIYDKISAEAKNKESVNQAVKNAENEFKSKATYPKKIFSSGKTIDNNLGDIFTIKSNAENKMKDEILKQLFTPQEELVWKEDYSLNHERTNQSGQATQSTINEAWKMYRDIELEKRLTDKNRAAIKQAGKTAIEDFKAKQAQDAEKAAAKLAKKQLSQTTSNSNNDQFGSQSPVAVVV